MSAAQQPSSRKWLWFVSSVAILAIAAALITWWNRPPEVPVVEAVAQLTDDGEPKRGSLTTDGARIYFNDGATGSWKIAQVAATGGTASVINTKLANPEIEAISPEGSSLLVPVENVEENAGSYPLWVVPIPKVNPAAWAT